MMNHSVNNNTCIGLVCLFVCSNSNPLISLILRTASNFRHLLSCGTIVELAKSEDCDVLTLSLPSRKFQLAVNTNLVKKLAPNFARCSAT